MARVYAVLAALVLALGGFLALMFGARKAGKDAAENEAKEQVIENVKKAKRARRRVVDNLDNADRLRKKYTRK